MSQKGVSKYFGKSEDSIGLREPIFQSLHLFRRYLYSAVGFLQQISAQYFSRIGTPRITRYTKASQSQGIQQQFYVLQVVVGILGILSIVYSRFRLIILNFYNRLGSRLEGAPTIYSSIIEYKYQQNKQRLQKVSSLKPIESLDFLKYLLTPF